jgi:hypothetical protein
MTTTAFLIPSPLHVVTPLTPREAEWYPQRSARASESPAATNELAVRAPSRANRDRERQGGFHG